MRHTDKGFIMLDSLMAVFIVICMCGLCFSIYKAVYMYELGYENYERMINDDMEDIFNMIEYCEACNIDEHD